MQVHFCTHGKAGIWNLLPAILAQGPFLFKSISRVDLFVLALLCLLLVPVKTTPEASQEMGGCFRRMGSDHPRTTSTVSEVARCVSGEFHHEEVRCWRCSQVSGARAMASTTSTSLPRFHSKPLNDVLLNSKVVSGRLETPKGPKESLKAAKRAAQVPPVKVQFAQCEQFVARAEKRLATHDEERIMFWMASNVFRNSEEVSQSPAPAPVQPPDWGAHVASLQQVVNTLQSGTAAQSGREGRRVVALNCC